MKNSRVSTVDWELDIYSKGKQLNYWPFSEVVSAIIQETAPLQRCQMSVLEIGCGAGNNLWFLAEEGFKASGIDISETAIDHVRNRLKGKGLAADLMVGDMLTLPWPDDQFDIVLDRGAITQNNHEYIKQMLDEILRVLKPSGILLSFTLKGINHPERLFGEEVSYHAYDNFSKGTFANVGLTSFFTAEDISGLFRIFNSVKITRHLKLDCNGEILDEDYSVRAAVQKK